MPGPANIEARKQTEHFQVFDPVGMQRNEVTRQMIAKFGQKVVDLLRQYGAYDCISDEEGNIIDVAPPEEYIAQSDQFALDRHSTSSYDTPSYMMTAPVLQRLAESEQARQLRADPAFLREQVEFAAQHRPELAPDEHGQRRTPAQLLAIPRYVAQQTRFIINDTLTYINQWAVIAAYLAEIAVLDETKGRLGVPRQRAELMACVSSALVRAIETVERRVINGIAVNSHLSKYWCRIKDHKDWEGAKVAVLNNCAEYEPYLRAASLDGALVRFASADIMYNVNYTRRDLRQSLLKAFLEASEDQLSRLEDFLELIDHPEECRMSTDEPYTKFINATEISQKILEKTYLEKYIKTSASLESPAVFAKIWKDIDGAAMKIAKSKVEDVLGFAPVAPRWSVSTIANPVQSPKVRQAQPKPQPTAPAEIKEIRKVNLIIRRDSSDIPKMVHVDPESAKIAPYGTQVELPPVAEPVPSRQGPKAKTKGIASSLTNAVAAPAPDVQRPTRVLPVFPVGKRVCNVFERLFSGGREKGQLKFSEFRYAMSNIGFSFVPAVAGGSIVTFSPPPPNIPFTCHKPHGGKTTIGPVLLREYETGLNFSYGWTLDWFARKSEIDGSDLIEGE
ncbi:hypothetical protein B0H13DRAFT_2332997 [Mycena leptocephala]|nr:hypothetical protein B0H13DRAFT_2332997 [Mycena leptocephala]